MASKGLSTEQAERLRSETKSAALVLADDLNHIRSIVSSGVPTSGDLRRMSALLRRMLIEGDIRKIASPRIGKVRVICPDMRVIYRSNEKQPILLTSSDTFTIGEHAVAGMMVEDAAIVRNLDGYDPDERVTLPLEVFQNQRVICFKGEWVTRAEIIKYMANVAHGIHSGKAVSRSDLIIRKVRGGLQYHPDVTGPDGKKGSGIFFDLSIDTDADAAIEINPKTIDLALMHLISTAQFLVNAPDTLKLEEYIHQKG